MTTWKPPTIWFGNHSFTTDSMATFMDVMENNNGDRNPFVSRSASFSLFLWWPYDDYWRGNEARRLEIAEENRLPFQEFSDQLISLLSKFGEHLFHFKLKLGAYWQTELEILEFFAEILCLLPNLKCLTIECELSCYQNRYYNKDLPESFNLPRLPYLKKLKLDVYKGPCWIPGCEELFPNYDCKSSINYILMSTYSQQAERLAIVLTHNGTYHIYLNLKEFEHYYCQDLSSGGYCFCNKDVSDGFNWKHPRPFHIHKWIISDTIEDDLIGNVLAKLPYLKYLEIRDELHHLRERGDISRICGRVKSLQYLKIEDNACLKYDFLLSFPSLKDLIIYRSRIPDEYERYRAAKIAVADGIMKIRRQIDSGFLYRSNVWSLLPELERVSLITLDKVRTFTRNVWDLWGLKAKVKTIKPKRKRWQQEADFVEWKEMMESNGAQYEECLGSILEKTMCVFVQNRWTLLDEE